MKEGKDITIYDIARQLNISAATVSRSLQDHSSISSATRMKVRAMAKDWDIAPIVLQGICASDKRIPSA